MGDVTKIAWTDHTFNPWEGCTKVSAGCAHCYAEARNSRFGGGTAPNWGPGAPRRRTSLHNWNEPRRWNRAAEKLFREHSEECAADPSYGMHVKPPRRPRVFCASLADWLDDEVPIEWLADLLSLIHDCYHLDWQLLTKRPQNWRPRLILGLARIYEIDTHEWIARWIDGTPPSNVWIGTSVENQDAAEARTCALLDIPAVVRFFSMEPLLGPVTFKPIVHCHDQDKPLSACEDIFGKVIHWVILGGESGAGARSCDVAWIRGIAGQCKKAGVPVFVKQLGARAYQSPEHDGATGFELELSHPKGGDPTEWPADLQIREFPTPQS